LRLRLNTIFSASLFLAVVLQTPAIAQTPAQAQTPGVEAARRVAATLQLAAQEYQLAFVNGVLANPAEWSEAQLFVAEARRSAGELPESVRTPLTPRLASLEQRLAAQMPPDSLAAEARRIEELLSSRLGVSLDERPAREPSLASGARIFRPAFRNGTNTSPVSSTSASTWNAPQSPACMDKFSISEGNSGCPRFDCGAKYKSFANASSREWMIPPSTESCSPFAMALYTCRAGFIYASNRAAPKGFPRVNVRAVSNPMASSRKR